MKRYFFAFAAAVIPALILTGCGSANTKTEEGMQQISALQYSDALVLFDEAKEAGEDGRLIARGRGIAKLGQADYEGAKESFLEALALSDGFIRDIDYDINYYLADAYVGLGDYEAAESTYSSIIDMREESKAYYLRGCMRLKLDMFSLAKDDFDKAAKIDPDDTGLIIKIFMMLEEAGYKEAGLEYINGILDGTDKNISSMDKGKLYYYMEDYQTAAVSLEEARNADQDNAEATLYLGRSYEAIGEYNYASNVYESFLARNSSEALIYDQLAICRMKLGEYSKALDSIQAGMQIGEPSVMRSLAFNEIIAYEHLGEFKKAQALVGSYLEMYPEDEAAKREQIFLQTR